MSIVTPPTGNFTPGAQATLDYSAAVINASWTLALQKSGEAQSKINTATTGFLDPLTAPTVSANTATGATVVEPTITIADASTSTVLADFDTEYLALIDLLAAKWIEFHNVHFPNDAAMYSSAESWIQAGMSDASGLPATVRAQMLADTQAAITAETSRAKDAVLAQFATRRFPLPPGAAASATLQLDQSAQDKMAEATRKVTIASVEQLRYIIDKAVGCRTLAMSATVDYVKALVSAPEIASKVVGIGYDAQSKMISAASQFYNSRISAAEQLNKVSQFNVSTVLDASSKNQAAELHLIDAKLKALLADVQTLAQQANALFNNLHANAGTSYSVSA